MTAIEAAPSLPIQPRDSFKCPSWCADAHQEEDVLDWEYGQWLVRHNGEWIEFFTAHSTEMRARLTWTEIVGSSPRLETDWHTTTEVGPAIEFDGDDGSGYCGVNEVVACDVAEWVYVLTQLSKQVEA